MPPVPTLDPVAAALLEGQRTQNSQLIEALKEGNTDRKEASRELLDFLRGQEKLQGERHTELLGNIGKVDAVVRKPPTGPASKVAVFVAESPAVKGAIANLIGILVLAIGAWITFLVTGQAPTPTPVQIAQPVATVPTSTTSTAADPAIAGH